METAKIYKCHPDAIIPEPQSTEAAGYDLHTIEDFELAPGERKVVGTGLVIQPPPGYHTEVLIRSGMAYKHNIMLINGVGLVDRDYAGPSDEMKVMMYRAPILYTEAPANDFGDVRKALMFKKGDRIAQFVFRKTHMFELEEVSEAPGDDRGGFGSTGH